MHGCIASYTVWQGNFTWNLILWFTVSGRTVKLQSVNCMHGMMVAIYVYSVLTDSVTMHYLNCHIEAN